MFQATSLRWFAVIPLVKLKTMRLRLMVAAVTLLSLAASAETVRGTPVQVGSIYLSPDSSSNKLADIDRGREVVILEASGDWLHVEAVVTEEKIITGWMMKKFVVQGSTPNGDGIVFGEAVESEDQASQRHGRRGAAQDAMRLYYRTAEYFPNSPLAAEAMYRSADIRWQIDKADVMSLPSAKEKESYLRQSMDEQYMKEVMKKFPGTKWADLAAFHLIENKICGDWQGSSKCPEKEAEMYEKYASEHPQSPAVAEALYDAAWRMSALIEMYKTDGESKKSDESRGKAIALAQKAVTQGPQSDWAARAQLLLFMIEQNIPTYGNGVE
jgi:outer membrane protein assembly factor BamD (BamD/ComL family)